MQAATHTATIPAELPRTGYIRVTKLAQALSISKTTLWRKSKNGTFPKPYKLSDGITAWKAEEILNWQAAIETKAVV